MKKLILVAAASALMLGGAALAQQANPHSAHGAHAMPKQSAPGSAQAAYEAANARMHKDMAITFSGNADVDFARGMIPHHQGAIDMARTVLEHGKDPELRKLAEEIVAAQEKEIAFLRAWLKKNQ